MKRRKREKKQKVQLRHLFDRLSQKCICFCIIWVDRLKVKRKVKFVFLWHWEENWRGFSQKIRNKSSIQHNLFSNSTQLPCILTKHKIQNTPILLSPAPDQFVTSLAPTQATGVWSPLAACDWSSAPSSRSHWSALAPHCSGSGSGPSVGVWLRIRHSLRSEPEVSYWVTVSTVRIYIIWRKVGKMLTAIDSGETDRERVLRLWRG